MILHNLLRIYKQQLHQVFRLMAKEHWFFILAWVMNLLQVIVQIPMPKNKFQEVIFTIMMVLVMVYAMICYNIVVGTGNMNNSVFISAFREMPLMIPVAFVLEFFLIGNLARKTADKMLSEDSSRMVRILAVSSVTVAYMCPCMSLVATFLFQDAGNQFIAAWMRTTVVNFPMAFFWQIFYAGPLVRFLFGNFIKN